MEEIHARYDPVLGAGVVDVLERLQRLRDLPLGLVQRRADGPGHLDRGLHARPDAHSCGAASPTSGSPSPSRSSTRACPTGRRWTGVAGRRRPRASCGATGSGSARRPTPTARAYPLRRPPPVHEDGDAVHPHRARPVPGRGRRHVAARRRAGPGRPRGRVADGPADRDARAAAGQEPRLRGARLRDRRRPTDFTTDLAVYQDGQEIARKTIRVNDPLSVGGLHVPPERVRAGAAPRRPRRGRASRCGTRPVPADRCRRRTCRTGSCRFPGRDLGLQLLLDRGRRRDRDRARRCRTASSGRTPTATPILEHYRGRRPAASARRGSRTTSASRSSCADFGEYTLLIAKQRPGAGPRLARVRLPDRRHHDHVLPAAPPGLDAADAPTAGSGIVWRSDRYVDVEREFGRLLDELVAARRRPDGARGARAHVAQCSHRVVRDARRCRNRTGAGAEPQPGPLVLVRRSTHVRSVRPHRQPTGDP